jgi:hypothetical protein
MTDDDPYLLVISKILSRNGHFYFNAPKYFPAIDSPIIVRDIIATNRTLNGMPVNQLFTVIIEIYSSTL